MNWWLIILLPLLSAFIGWITIKIAISMLFRPKKPVRVLGITFQGIFPRRQEPIAQRLSKLVSNELLSFGEIEQKIAGPENLKKIMPVVEQQIDDFLHHRLKEKFPMIGMFIGERTIGQLKSLFMSELESIFPVVMSNYVKNLQQDLNLEQMVVDKIMAVSPDTVEEILYQNMAKEFSMAGLFGALIGLLIGLIQVLLVMWAQ